MNVNGIREQAPPHGASEEMQQQWYEEQKARRGWIGLVLGDKEQVAVYGAVLSVILIIGFLGFGVWQSPESTSDTLGLFRYMFAAIVGFLGGAMKK